ncbi:MAG: T9SS type A sorting domain-containing protein, partial [Cytophagales bacterium]|nr:T9SS type A sorting domain-containing protein [Cytophagales bacterium]
NMVFDMPSGSNYFSVAVMSNTSQATLDLYESKAFNFITQTVHTYSFSEANSTLTTNFDVTTSPVYGGVNTGTLQCLYKHQWKYSPQAAGALNTGLTYISPRGDMKVLATNSFSTVMKHYGLLPNLGFAHKYNPTQMRAYIDNFLATQSINQEPADGYAKDGFVDFANIAQIADQIGYTTAQNKALDAMESRLVDWFTANDPWAMFVYDANFNYLAHYPNGFTSSGLFIDMHFHMAYLIYGAAILARYRPAFATQYGAMVETMIRQINDYRKDNTNPGNIGWFPYLRFFDPYAGHSWAGPDAADQESVSEAMLFNYGVFLWGDITNNSNLRDLGALLYITEAEAGKMYWFDTDHSINYNWQGGTYPQNHMTIVRHRGGSYATYFSADDRWKHSINILPATAGTLWMSWDDAQSQTMFNDLPAGGYTAWDDHGYFYDFLQVSYDPTAGKSAFNTYAVSEQWINPTFPHVNGDIPILYQWVNTFDSVGVYDNTVQADITQFSVFTKGTCKHYMVFNPKGRGIRTVHFTDGQVFTVPDDTLITFKVCNVPLSSNTLNFEVKKLEGKKVRLNWSMANQDKYQQVTPEFSLDGKNWKALPKSISSAKESISNQHFYTHENPESGTNYYRLKMIEVDGSVWYSEIHSVDVFFWGEGFSLFPNPAEGQVFVRLNGMKSNSINIRLVDIHGQEIVGKTSEEQLELDISSLPAGMYMVELRDLESQKLYRERLVKW